MFVENQVCCFVEALMKIFVVNGNQVGCLVEAFMHFIGAINWFVLFVGALINFVIAWID